MTALRNFRQRLLFLLLLAAVGTAAAQTPYRPTDPAHPIDFAGDRIRYEGREIVLGPRCFFVDGSLSDAEAARSPYVFNRFNEAAARLTAGTAEAPMRLYIAPWVYWIDDPDDPAVRIGEAGREPFGLVVRCPGLQLIGLTADPRNVVLASARGQTQGAVGNFTMFDFWGDDLLVENLTMGNFCNVDLDYPLRPELSRPKRLPAITQAHVAYCHGDRIVARNVRFISRLNMNPLNGARRILFDRCHMESTDDALTGTGVYLHCTLDFYGPRPFYTTDRCGAVFLDCDFTVCHRDPRTYFCKAPGALTLVDCRFHAGRPLYAGWVNTPPAWLRSYQSAVTLDGQPYVVGADNPANTVPIDRRALLGALRVEVADTVVYNTYNLLRGDDNWDPLGVRPAIEAASQRDGRDYTRMATSLTLTPRTATLRTGDAPLCVEAAVKRHAGFAAEAAEIAWRIEPGFEKDLRIAAAEGSRCTIVSTVEGDLPKQCILTASTPEGLEGAVALTLCPAELPAPTFTEQPRITIGDGVARVDYRLALDGRADRSVITWYRCGKGYRIPVATSRSGIPERTYRLTAADAGCRIAAVVAPCHLRSQPGPGVEAITATPVRRSQVPAERTYETDFHNFPTDNQPLVLAGCWSVDTYKPADTAPYDWQPDPTRPGWIYGAGFNGAKGTGLLQEQRGARLRYTPASRHTGDMEVRMEVDPTKTAGQGFGSATGQYMDICLQFDTRTLTGYALRIERTTKYAHAVDFSLVRYDNGETKAICTPVSSVCYRTGCTICVRAEGERLTAHVETATPVETDDPNLTTSVDLQAPIERRPYGGVAIQHTGSCGESTTMLHRLQIRWND